MRLRESQLKNVETENKCLRAKVEELTVQGQQEKKELEAVVLELQAQLSVCLFGFSPGATDAQHPD